jgi:predicted nucleic acid-binding protein
MRADFLADTNLLIYIHEGNPSVSPFLSYEFAISFISEIELLGFNNLSVQDEKKLIALIDDCWCIEWNAEIKAQTINLRKKYKIKLPDAIIAATAITYELPLVSADQGFSQIEELDFILLNFD